MSATPICPGFNKQSWLSSAHISARLPNSLPFYLEAGMEKHVDMGEMDSLNFYSDNADMLGMRCVPSTMSEFLVGRFKAIENVRAVLIGESNEVHHVWVLLNEWTFAHRKAVYAVQRDILQKVKGYNFDFYVVDIPAGTDPRDMVSDIPIAYQRD